MPKLRVLKSKKIKNIPCKNPHSYCDVVEPIYEIHLVKLRRANRAAVQDHASSKGTIK